MEILLGELKEALISIDEDVVLDFGFDTPHSYRGMYECVSFEPTGCRKVGELIKCIFEGLDNKFTGWKGGEFEYTKRTPVFFAYEGNLEDGVGCHEYDGEMSDLRQYFYTIVQEYKERTK